jgi:hypothetical protein
MKPRKKQGLATGEDVIENHKQAQALVDSLSDEMERYRDHIIQIEMKLRALKDKWGVTPRISVVDVTPKTKLKQGLTVGEVSKMLGGIISKPTVQRYLDQGILTGWKNPITGRRVIDLESVRALAKKSGIELSEGMEAWPRRGRPKKTTSRPSSGS